MSITFDYVGADRHNGPPEPCLCSQMAPGWPRCSAEVLKEHADAACEQCAGTGTEPRSYVMGDALNVSEGNAPAVLALLGLDWNETQCMTLPQARRALIYGRNRFTALVRRLSRPEEETKKPGQAYMWIAGLGEEKLRSYLDRFEKLIEAAEKAGSEGIVWG